MYWGVFNKNIENVKSLELIYRRANMLGRTLARFKKKKTNEPAPETSPQQKSQAVPTSRLAKMLSASGRVSLASLRNLAQENKRNQS